MRHAFCALAFQQTFLAAAVAGACSGEIFVSTPPDGATVPANISGVYLENLFGDTVTEVRLRGGSVDQVIQAEDGVVALPILTSQTSYSVSAIGLEPPNQFRFETTGEEDFPSALPSLSVVYGGGDIEVNGPSACPSNVDSAYVDVFFDNDIDLGSWEDALAYEVEVDGTRQMIRPEIQVSSPGVVRLVGVCEETNYEGIGEGQHSVKIIGTALGAGTEIASPAVDIDLDCATTASSGCSTQGATAPVPMVPFAIAILLVFGRSRHKLGSTDNSGEEEEDGELAK